MENTKTNYKPDAFWENSQEQVHGINKNGFNVILFSIHVNQFPQTISIICVIEYLS
jgi:hypothetical protein